MSLKGQWPWYGALLSIYVTAAHGSPHVGQGSAAHVVCRRRKLNLGPRSSANSKWQANQNWNQYCVRCNRWNDAGLRLRFETVTCSRRRGVSPHHPTVEERHLPKITHLSPPVHFSRWGGRGRWGECNRLWAWRFRWMEEGEHQSRVSREITPLQGSKWCYMSSSGKFSHCLMGSEHTHIHKGIVWISFIGTNFAFLHPNRSETLQATDSPIGSTQMFCTAEKWSTYFLNWFFFFFRKLCYPYCLCFSMHQMFSKGDASDKSSNIWSKSGWCCLVFEEEALASVKVL